MPEEENNLGEFTAEELAGGAYDPGIGEPSFEEPSEPSPPDDRGVDEGGVDEGSGNGGGEPSEVRSLEDVAARLEKAQAVAKEKDISVTEALAEVGAPVPVAMVKQARARRLAPIAEAEASRVREEEAEAKRIKTLAKREEIVSPTIPDVPGGQVATVDGEKL